MARTEYTFTFTNAQPGAQVSFGDHPVFSSASDTGADGPNLTLDADNTVVVWSDAATLTARTVDGRGEAITVTATRSNSAVTSSDGTPGTSPFSTGTYAPLASPALTGNPTAPTQSVSDNSTKIATTAYVDSADATVKINTQSGAAYTLVLGDAGKVIRRTNASASTTTVPPNSDVAFPTGTVINVYAAGAGGDTLTAGSGVTIRNNSAAVTQYGEVSIRKDGTDEWVRTG